MGSVYKAADNLLRRFVAVKMLHASSLERRTSVARFEREARASAAIGHPNIVDVLDFGHTDGKPFLVMEYLRGRPLTRLIREEGQLTIERACRIATHALTGLHAAHAHGIVHRDLKPANLMLISHLGEPDFVKICDFGFAAMLISEEEVAPADTSLTPARTLVGTPAYAAPERLRGKGSREPTSDVYSVGVVLYEMLTRRRPFMAKQFSELSREVLRSEPPSLHKLRADVPIPLANAVHRALAKSPSRRWQSAETFAESLAPFGGRFIPSEPPEDVVFTPDLATIQARKTNRLRSISEAEASSLISQQTDLGTTAIRAPLATPALTRDLLPSLPESDPCIHGGLVVSTLRFIGKRFGERALRSTLDALPSPARNEFAKGVSNSDEVRLPSVVELITHVDRHLGNDDLHLVVQCGKAMADGIPSLMEASSGEELPIIQWVKRLPSVSRRIVGAGHFSASRVGDGFARLELVETQDAQLVLHVALLGLLERGLEIYGGKDGEASMLSSRALGDPRTCYELTWL
jgi:serine/threonine protein kinase